MQLVLSYSNNNGTHNCYESPFRASPRHPHLNIFLRLKKFKTNQSAKNQCRVILRGEFSLNGRELVVRVKLITLY